MRTFVRALMLFLAFSLVPACGSEPKPTRAPSAKVKKANRAPKRPEAKRLERQTHARHEHEHLHPHEPGDHHHHPHPHPHLAGAGDHHHPF